MGRNARNLPPFLDYEPLDDASGAVWTTVAVVILVALGVLVATFELTAGALNWLDETI